MGFPKAFEKASGLLRIGIIDSIYPDRFRCDIQFPGAVGNIVRDVSISPHAQFGIMPFKGDIVAVYDRPGYGKRVIAILQSKDDRDFLEILQDENKLGVIPEMASGDTYIGNNSRAYFYENGDAIISSDGDRAKIELRYEDARSILYGHNFSLESPGRGVRVRSVSTVSAGPLATFGDSLRLEVNTPIQGEVIEPITRGSMTIDNLGGIALDTLPYSPMPSNFSMDSIGNIELGRGYPTKTIGLVMSSGSDISLFNPSGLIDISSDGSIKAQTPLSEISLSSDGSFDLSTESYSLGITTVGGLSYIGKSVDIDATTTALVRAASSLSMQANNINIGAVSAGHVTIAELLAPIWTAIDAMKLLLVAHTHTSSAPGSQSAPSAQLVALSATSFSTLGNANLIGSKTVTVQI